MAPPNAAAAQHTARKLVWATTADYAALSLHFMRLGTLVMALCCFAFMVNPDLQMGLLRVVQLDMRLLPQIVDMDQRRIVIAGVFFGLFLADLFQRNTRPVHWTHLTSLSGFAVLGVATGIYTLEGKVGAIAVALYGGACVLSLALMASVIQRTSPLKHAAWIEANLMRVVSTIFAILAGGLWTQRDSSLTTFIETRYGWLLGVIILLLVWGHAQLRHNHLATWDAFRRVSVFLLFAGMMVYFITYDPSASLMGAGLSVYLLGLIILTVWFQAQAPLSAQEKTP